MAYRTRRRGHGRQPGTHFPVQGQSEGRLLRDLLTETRRRDINMTIGDFVRVGKELQKEGSEELAEVQRGQKVVGQIQVKMQALREIISTLEQLKQSGRTQVGEIELQTVVRQVVGKYGIPASAFDK